MLKSSNTHAIEVPKQEKGAKAMFEKIIAENIPKTSGSSVNLKQNKYKRNHT